MLHFLCDNVFLNSQDDQAEVAIADLALKLIELGLDPNDRDVFGNTALHLAGAAGNAKIAKELMPKANNLDARNHEGNSCLHLACKGGHAEIVEFGDDFDVVDPWQYNAFMSQRETFVKRIVQNLDSNIADDSQTTILHLLCQYGYSKAAEFVIQRGKGLECENNQGQTALHIACQYGHGEVARLLIKSGCNRNAVNTLTQERSFETALNNTHYDVAMILVKEFKVNISESLAKKLGEVSLEDMEDGKKTEITKLRIEIELNPTGNPSPYPKLSSTKLEEATPLEKLRMF